MCDPFIIAAGTAVTAIGQVQQGNAKKAEYEFKAAQEEDQARIAQDDALATAGLIRRATERQRGEARTAYAASGVAVDSGSAQEIDHTISEGGEHDALMTILTGTRQARAGQQQAVLYRAAGANAQRAGYIDAIGTALAGGYNAMRASGWRSAGPGFSGTQAPAPVETRYVPRG